MFQKAVKHEAKLRLAVVGPAGSGKTFTALKIATAMSDRIAVVDTENGSASKYADLFSFDTVNFMEPYHPDRFVEAIQAAAAMGYEVVVLDSLSHAWSGPGGVLSLKEQFARQKQYNDYTAWQPAGQIHERLVQAIKDTNIHIIATMRSKMKYATEEYEQNGRTRTRVVKLGVGVVQRDEFEYEFDVVGEMDHEHYMVVTKTRCIELTDRVFHKPGEELAQVLVEWLRGEKGAVQFVGGGANGQTHPNGSSRANGGGGGAVDPFKSFWHTLSDGEQAAYRSAATVVPQILARAPQLEDEAEAGRVVARFAGEIPVEATREDGLARVRLLRLVERFVALVEAGLDEDEAGSQAQADVDAALAGLHHG